MDRTSTTAEERETEWHTSTYIMRYLHQKQLLLFATRVGETRTDISESSQTPSSRYKKTVSLILVAKRNSFGYSNGQKTKQSETMKYNTLQERYKVLLHNTT